MPKPHYKSQGGANIQQGGGGGANALPCPPNAALASEFRIILTLILPTKDFLHQFNVDTASF